MPASLALTEMVLFVELFRTHTAFDIKPLSVGVPKPELANQQFFGCPLEQSTFPTITLSLADSKRRLVSANVEIWEMFEPKLRHQLASRLSLHGIKPRLRNALLEAIPSGEATIVQLAAKLHLSKRSLQRHLSDEGTSFKQVLEETRAELAEHYLSRTSATLEEISYLLGYTNPASFFRAFQTWFGMTPTAYRMSMDVAS